MDEKQEKETLENNEINRNQESGENNNSMQSQAPNEKNQSSVDHQIASEESQPSNISQESHESTKTVQPQKQPKASAEKTKPAPTTKSSGNSALTILAIILSAVAICFSAVTLFLSYRQRKTTGTGNNITSFNDDNASSDAGNSTNFAEGSISDVANKVSPSVVSITTETRNQSFYGQSSSTAAGTGFIISSDGYVLTNKHVVDGANKISIVLDDGTTYDKVQLVGTDPLNDCAIVKIENAKELPAVKLGDSKTINIGQSVIAIGNALGLYQNTVTSGIISGVGRSLVAGDSTGGNYETLSDMIQTDAAINQGNSGGPLVNAAGEVIGINTAISSSTTGTGFGFAIPISSVKGIVKSVLETGTFKRAYLGVYYNNITPDIAKQNNLPVTNGAYVNSSKGSAVVKDSAADKAGIKDGDIITAVNGTKIGKAGTLSSLLGEYTVGDTVSLTILRNGSDQKIDITLSEYKNK